MENWLKSPLFKVARPRLLVVKQGQLRDKAYVSKREAAAYNEFAIG